MSLATNIRYLRKKQGWGQDILAEKLGYKSYTTIQKWESGVSEPPLKVCHVLASLFNVDINDLTGTDLDISSRINPVSDSSKMPTLETEDGRARLAMELFNSLSDVQKNSAISYLQYLARGEATE